MPSLAQLTTGELLLVASLRLYATPFHDRMGKHLGWRGGFIAAGIGPVAVPAFAALFGIVSRVPLYPLEIGCPHCQGLGRDEVKFLRMTALHQHGLLTAAAAILHKWLPPAAARMAGMPALGLAFALDRGGLRILRRDAMSAAPDWPLPDRGQDLVQ
jgi:hypothetical protein